MSARGSISRRRKCREGEMFRLVKIYHDHKCLWDRSHPDYKIKFKRYQALEAIGAALQLTSLEDVKKKIKSLRDTYTAEKNRMKKSLRDDADSDEVYRTKLSWYNFADSFLNGSGGSHRFADQQTHPETGGPLSPDDCTITLPYGADQYAELVKMECVCDDSSIPDINEPVNRFYNSKSKQADRIQQNTTNTEEETDALDGPFASSMHDEFYYFGMNVASQLRTLPKINALVLQDKIHKIIFDERLLFERATAFHQNQMESIVRE